MLQIRPAQFEPFKQPLLERFRRRMLDHIATHFPQHYRELGEAQTLELIDLGIERARRHGFVGERDVCKYTALMLTLGPEFDEDPCFPWVQQILHDHRDAPRPLCMDALCDRALEDLRAREGQAVPRP